MTLNRVLGPQAQVQIRDVLDRTKNDVFYNLNCVQVGSIVSYDPEKNTASLQIGMKRQLPNNEIIDYPVLQDCPVFFLTGGQAYISMPIEPGDSCLILFNDRDIDTWWATGANNIPNTPRSHSLSDAICLVGIRNQSDNITLKTNAIEINGGNKKVLINSESANISINSGTGLVGIKNDATNLKLVLDGLFDQLSNTLVVWLQTSLINTLQALTVQNGPAVLPLTVASQTALAALAPTMATLKIQLEASKAQLALLLNSGE